MSEVDFFRWFTFTCLLTLSNATFSRERCQCAVFDSDYIPGSYTPSVASSIDLTVRYDNTPSMEECKVECREMATTIHGTEKLIQETLCNIEETNVHFLESEVFYKSSTRTDWEYSDYTFKSGICCHSGGRPVICPPRSETK